uniref:Uncharacterized protein n=1 Tax=Trichinella nativa TaxID=6335 RepID=A0A0V1JEK1_9BILA
MVLFNSFTCLDFYLFACVFLYFLLKVLHHHHEK